MRNLLTVTALLITTSTTAVAMTCKAQIVDVNRYDKLIVTECKKDNYSRTTVKALTDNRRLEEIRNININRNMRRR